MSLFLLWWKAALMPGAHQSQSGGDLPVVRIPFGGLLHGADGEILLTEFPVAQAKRGPRVRVPRTEANGPIELCCSVSDLAAMEQAQAMLKWVTAGPSIPSLGVTKGGYGFLRCSCLSKVISASSPDICRSSAQRQREP